MADSFTQAKKPKQNFSPSTNTQEVDETHSISCDFDMSQTLDGKLQAILEKLEKLDIIESTVKSIQANLTKLEARTQKLEHLQAHVKKEIEDLQEGARFAEEQLKQKFKAFNQSQQTYDSQMNDLRAQIKECKERAEESETKNLYLEAYSRRENLKFMNITEDTSQENGREDTEEVLRSFMERELGYMNTRNVEIQRVHRIGKITSNKTRPILARFLRYKDCQEILSLGHRLKGTNFQIFKDLPKEIISRRKTHMESFKTAKKHGVPASFSQSQPDKLYIRGKLWPVDRKFSIN